jgi:hypothetical protein
MRVLITTSPLYGHFFPMLPLIDTFRQDGHQVTVATGPDLADAVRRRNLRCWVLGPGLGEVLAGLGKPRLRPGSEPEPEADPVAALRGVVMAVSASPRWPAPQRCCR